MPAPEADSHCRRPVKRAMSSVVTGMLRRYVTSGLHCELTNTTFRYIADFIAIGRVIPRLPIACLDFGYTIAELQAWRARGGTSAELAWQVIDRGLEAEPIDSDATTDDEATATDTSDVSTSTSTSTSTPAH